MALALMLLLGLVAAASSGRGPTAVAAGPNGIGPQATAALAQPPLPPLSSSQLIGQRMIFSYGGTSPPGALRRRVARGEAAGVILFGRNIASRSTLRATLRALQSIPRPLGLSAPLLVLIDQEGGLVKRLDGAPRRSPAALGAIGSRSLAMSEGRATARNLRSVGINVDLAPVVDVARAGSFQERVLRTYGRSPALVGALGSAFATGLQQGGVAATAKHFPGIGAPRANQDDVASRIGLSQATLRRIDEAPFAETIGTGIKLVLVGVAVYPAFDARPAMFSRRVTTDELRGRLGFTGVSITDDLETRAASPFGSPARRALLATRAGADLLLFAQTYDRGARAADALEREARDGRISQAELRHSAARVLALRASLSPTR